MQLPWIIRGLLIASGAAMSLWALVRWVRSRRPRELLDGAIVRIRCDRSGLASTYHPTIRFRAPDGTDVEFENLLGALTPRWNSGDPVYVHLDGDHARLHDPDLGTHSYLAIGLMGMLIVVVGLVGFLSVS